MPTKMTNSSSSTPKPTKEDAELLIRLYAIAQEEHVYHAFLWYYEHFGYITDRKNLITKPTSSRIGEDPRATLSGRP
jgi:hypothetical protein